MASTSPNPSVSRLNSTRPLVVGAGKNSRARTWLRSRRLGSTSSTMNSRITGEASRRPATNGPTVPLEGR